MLESKVNVKSCNISNNSFVKANSANKNNFNNKNVNNCNISNNSFVKANFANKNNLNITKLLDQIEIESFLEIDLEKLLNGTFEIKNSNLLLDLEILKYYLNIKNINELIQIQNKYKIINSYNSLKSILSFKEIYNLLELISIEEITNMNAGNLKNYLIKNKILENNPIFYKHKINKISYKIALAAKIDYFNATKDFKNYFKENNCKINKVNKEIIIKNTRRGGIKAREKRNKKLSKKKIVNNMEYLESSSSLLSSDSILF